MEAFHDRKTRNLTEERVFLREKMEEEKDKAVKNVLDLTEELNDVAAQWYKAVVAIERTAEEFHDASLMLTESQAIHKRTTLENEELKKKLAAADSSNEVHLAEIEELKKMVTELKALVDQASTSAKLNKKRKYLRMVDSGVEEGFETFRLAIGSDDEEDRHEMVVALEYRPFIFELLSVDEDISTPSFSY